MIAAVEADDGQVSGGHPLVAVLAGHADALFRPAATAVARIRGDRPALPRPLLDAVAVAQTTEVVPLDRAGVAATLGGADHVNGLDVLEDFLDREQLSHFEPGRVGHAKLADIPLRLRIGLGGQGYAGGLAGFTALGFQLFGDVAAFRPSGAPPRLILEAELHGVVAVALLVPDLQYRARAHLQDGHRGNPALVVIDLRHPNLKTEQPQRHGNNLTERGRKQPAIERTERLLCVARAVRPETGDLAIRSLPIKMPEVGGCSSVG